MLFAPPVRLVWCVSSVTAGASSNTFLTLFLSCCLFWTCCGFWLFPPHGLKALQIQGIPAKAKWLHTFPWDILDANGVQEAAGSNPVTRTTSLRTTYRSQRLFYQKVTSHSFCRSSSPNRTRFAGLRFGFTKPVDFKSYNYTRTK